MELNTEDRVVSWAKGSKDGREFFARCKISHSIPESFGDGWMSRAAQDWFRIFVFAGFDGKAMARRIVAIHAERRMKTIQVRHVEEAMEEVG